MSRQQGDALEDFEHYFTEHPKALSKPRYGRSKLLGREFVFETDRGVFSKDYVDLGTRRLIETVRLPENAEVLDWGCGYGAIGIALAAAYPKGRFFMIDINERAVALTRRNIKLNRIKNAVVLKSDSFANLPSDLRFDAILTNPPIHAGKQKLLQLILGAHRRLKLGGSFWLVARTQHGAKTLQRFMEQVFGNSECVDRHGGFRVIMSVKETDETHLDTRRT